MRTILTLVALSAAAPAFAQGSHYVQGYTNSNGTYVQPHYQTNPDGNVYNNWSTQGNVNPYTGQAGTLNPGLNQGVVGPPNAGYNGSRRSGYGY